MSKFVKISPHNKHDDTKPSKESTICGIVFYVPNRMSNSHSVTAYV